MRLKTISSVFWCLLLVNLCINGLMWAQQPNLQQEQEKSYLLKDIILSGATKYSVENILNFAHLKRGEKIQIPGPKIRYAVKKLMKSGLFGNVSVFIHKIEGDHVVLAFNLSELPKISDIKVIGVKKSNLEDVLKKNNIKIGEHLTEDQINATKSDIKNIFLDKGYLDVQTKMNFQENLEAPGKLNVEVSKGPRVKVENIVFFGNKQLSSGHLRSVMKNTKEKRIWRVYKRSKFVQEKFDNDLKSILDEYRSLGFIDARILSYNRKINPNNKQALDIDIYLEEGKRYYIRSINWIGNNIFSNEVLNRVLTYKKGDPYDVIGFQKRVSGSFGLDDNNIATLYQNEGYVFSQVIPIEKSVVNDSIDIEINIQEGEKAYFNRINFSGNIQTHDHVISRLLRTRPGDVYSTYAIKRSYLELGQSKLIDPSKIEVYPKVDPETKTVDVDWKIEQRGSSQIELQGGYGGGRFMGSLGLSFGDFSIGNLLKGKKWSPIPMGDGQQLALRVQAGFRYHSYSISFTEPWLRGFKNQTSLYLSLSHSTYNSLKSLQNSADFFRPIDADPFQITNNEEIKTVRGKLQITGINLGLSQRLSWPDDYFSISHNIGFQRYKMNNYDFSLPLSKDDNIFSTLDEHPPKSEKELVIDNGSSNNLSYTIALARRSAGPDPIFPTSGSDFSLSLKLTPPYSLLSKKDYKKLSEQEKYRWLEYYKLRFSGQWYKELFGKLVLKLGGEFGYLGTYNSEIGVSPFERFYLGGTGMFSTGLDGREAIQLRGYEDPNSTGGTVKDITPRGGGTIYNRFLLELRYPIVGSGQTRIWSHLFYEAGATYADYKNFSPFQLKRSLGLGFRIFMPAFGILGIDFGYGFDPYLYQKKPSGWQTHFIIGQSF